MTNQTIVVKVGTSSLTYPETSHLALSTIANFVETPHYAFQVSTSSYHFWCCENRLYAVGVKVATPI